jgi:hypothetical protein
MDDHLTDDGRCPPDPRTALVCLLASLPAMAVFLWHASRYGSWLIDDAGISFAYARDLAGGFGLTSQPGREPVEGFSNPLWTLAFASLYALKLFSLPLVPKVVACVLGALFPAVPLLVPILLFATLAGLIRASDRRAAREIFLVGLVVSLSFDDFWAERSGLLTNQEFIDTYLNLGHGTFVRRASLAPNLDDEAVQAIVAQLGAGPPSAP